MSRKTVNIIFVMHSRVYVVCFIQSLAEFVRSLSEWEICQGNKNVQV